MSGAHTAPQYGFLTTATRNTQHTQHSPCRYVGNTKHKKRATPSGVEESRSTWTQGTFSAVPESVGEAGIQAAMRANRVVEGEEDSD